MNKYCIALVLLLGLMHGEVEANDRYMMETMEMETLELVVLSQKVKLDKCL